MEKYLCCIGLLNTTVIPAKAGISFNQKRVVFKHVSKKGDSGSSPPLADSSGMTVWIGFLVSRMTFRSVGLQWTDFKD